MSEATGFRGIVGCRAQRIGGLAMRARFLITDHDPRIAEETRRCLASRGYDVAVATNGLQCLEQLRAMAPTVLVLDPRILWGGGAGVLDWLIHEEPLMPPTVVIADGEGSAELPSQFQSWVDSRIERPKSLSDLLRFVNQLEAVGWWTVSDNRTAPSRPNQGVFVR